MMIPARNFGLERVATWLMMEGRKLLPARVQSAITGLMRDRRGVSSVEFALLLPVMLLLYLGTVEVSEAVAVDRKVTLTTRILADLASQVTSINNADMTNILNSAVAVIAPYDVTKFKIVLSAITIDNAGIAKIAWSDTLNGTKRTVGATVTVPTAIKINNTTLIWGEATYDYKAVVGYVVTGTLTLSDQIYMRPRLSDTVTRVNS
jgi:Flp pilus assembly protein TadG